MNKFVSLGLGLLAICLTGCASTSTDPEDLHAEAEEHCLEQLGESHKDQMLLAQCIQWQIPVELEEAYAERARRRAMGAAMAGGMQSYSNTMQSQTNSYLQTQQNRPRSSATGQYTACRAQDGTVVTVTGGGCPSGFSKQY